MLDLIKGIGFVLVFSLVTNDARGHTIRWEATDRFRFFTDADDFKTFIDAYKAVMPSDEPVLAAERWLALRPGNEHGWAAAILKRTCWDILRETLRESCLRNQRSENYLNPESIPVDVWIEASPAIATHLCEWTLPAASSGRSRTETRPCSERIPITLRAAGFDKSFKADVSVRVAGANETPTTQTIAIRHVHVAGIGDSIASGEGNPDQPVRLDDRAVCYTRSAFLNNTPDTPKGERRDVWRPGRAQQSGPPACEENSADQRAAWGRASALWLSPACHRSLYGNQMRSAIQLAVERGDIVVTYIPLGCTGATIADGLLKGRSARETYCYLSGNGARVCNKWVDAQIVVLETLARTIRRGPKVPAFDSILLTVGANDIGFSGLVASVLLNPDLEKFAQRFGFLFETTETARRKMRLLPGGFRDLALRLKPLVGQDLKRVIYVLYPNPALSAPNEPCGGGRRGLDVHPQMRTDPGELKRAFQFTEEEFFPKLAQLARCPLRDRKCEQSFTLVDKHQSLFASRGYCTVSSQDPIFDRQCFRDNGDAFFHPGEPDLGTLRCRRNAGDYRAYASRQRWIRTPNDSYFAANTFPDNPPTPYISDPWNLLIASTYGGAIHPTAEGHAAMADAITPKLIERLGLPKRQ